jgi:integrase
MFDDFLALPCVARELPNLRRANKRKGIDMTVANVVKSVRCEPRDTKQKGRKQPLRPQQIKGQVLSALANGITDLRDRAVVMMLIESGIRASELVLLDREIILLEGPKAGNDELRDPKSSFTRQFRVYRNTVRALQDYLSTARDQDSNPALFVDEQGKRLTQHSLRAMVYRWCDELGIDRISLHQFRYSLAQRRQRRGFLGGPH